MSIMQVTEQSSACLMAWASDQNNLTTDIKDNNWNFVLHWPRNEEGGLKTRRRYFFFSWKGYLASNFTEFRWTTSTYNINLHFISEDLNICLDKFLGFALYGNGFLLPCLYTFRKKWYKFWNTWNFSKHM